MAVMVANLGATLIATGPVITGVVRFIGKIGRAVRHCPGQDIVLIDVVVAALYPVAVFVQCGFQRNPGVVKVQISQVCTNQGAMRVVPGTLPYSVTGKYASAVRFLGAEICTPFTVSGPGCRRQLLAMAVSTFQSAKVSTVTHPDTGDKKAH